MIYEEAKKIAALIISWYASSISLQLYNKWLFSKENSDFKYPLFTTMIHMIMQSLLSAITIYQFWPAMKPNRIPNKRQYLFHIVPCGLTTALDIGLSNSSLRVIFD
jgi:solute carrier family 35 protein C2